MKHLLIVVLLLTSLNAQDFIQKDKVQHMVGGLFIYGGCVILGEILKKQDVTDSVNVDTCLLAVAGVAFGKELWDGKHDGHVSDWNDATSTVIAPMAINITYKWGGLR